jgi:hypothetical protein
MIRLIKLTRDYLKYFEWILQGKSIPINHVVKRKQVLKIAKRYNCEIFVETGTFYGQMVEAVRKSFSSVLSVELSETLYKYNKKKFLNCSNVQLFWGDSQVCMGEMLSRVSGRTIFWLDGHYSGPGTARGTIDCPLLAELNAICKHNRNDHCILIDDARFFNGSNGYPNFVEVKRNLLEINPDYQIFINNDCIIALPPLTK